MTLPAGTLRQRVDVLQHQSGLDQAGQPLASWKAVAQRVPCDIRFTGGSESAQGRQVEAIGTHTVRMRYRTDVTPASRLQWGDEVLEIESVGDPTGLRRELVAVCRSLG
jgi:SPP1 family predicted phage head-tail adaptor